AVRRRWTMREEIDDGLAGPDPGIRTLPRARRAPPGPAPVALARRLAASDGLLAVVRQGHRLAPARRQPPQALGPARRPRPAARARGPRPACAAGRLPDPA